MTIMVAKKKVSDAGSCNFCDKPHTVIYEVKSDDRNPITVVRFCMRCLQKLRKTQYL